MLFSLERLMNFDISECQKNKSLFSLSDLLKERRRDLSLTLKESADGICSLSYLSKVEQRQINPKDLVVKKLIKKYNIEETELFFDDEKFKEILKTSIKEHYENEILTNYYYVVFKQTNYKSNLLRFAYLVTNNKKEQAYEIYQNLESKFKMLDSYEIIYFYYFLALLLQKDNKNLQANKLLKKVVNKTSYDKLNTLVKKLFISTLVKINKYKQALDMVSELKEKFLINGDYKHIKQLDADIIRYTVSNCDYNYFENIICQRESLTRQEKAVLFSINSYKQNDTSKALKYFCSINNLDDTLKLYYACLLDLENKTEEALLFLENYKDSLNHLSLEVYNFLKNKITLDEKNFLKFILKRYFKDCEVEHYQFLNFIFKSVKKYYIEKNMYKNVVDVLLEFEKTIIKFNYS